MISVFVAIFCAQLVSHHGNWCVCVCVRVRACVRACMHVEWPLLNKAQCTCTTLVGLASVYLDPNIVEEDKWFPL